ncbi:hypothetical protein N7G274_000287 [Stereocaulon virgatum]|uniref:Glycine zipper 2TM domain-containing protein n=1 Tax=Stereocaulon virgatum TaxID=373712 RepID=A0ABR4AUG5_9LECA
MQLILSIIFLYSNHPSSTITSIKFLLNQLHQQTIAFTANMSDPYNQYGQNYGQYPPQQPQYGHQQGYPPPAPQYGESQGYGPPHRTNSFGPPQAGGFQHGQQGGQYGAYDSSNPQGHSGYYGNPPPQDPRSGGYGGPSPQPGQQYGQQPPYGQDPNQYPPQHQQQQGFHDPNMPPADPNAPYDPNAAPEGERGIMGAIGGGLAGRYAGKQMGGHSILGMIGGAIAGSKLEDAAKNKWGSSGSGSGGGGHHHGSHHGSQGGSSWGGSNFGGGRY